MKDLFQVLYQKEMDIQRVRKEIEALHYVIPLLAENEDWIENGMVPPRSISMFPGNATANPMRGEQELAG